MIEGANICHVLPAFRRMAGLAACGECTAVRVRMTVGAGLKSDIVVLDVWLGCFDGFVTFLAFYLLVESRELILSLAVDKAWCRLPAVKRMTVRAFGP